jgi:5-methyltetrahydrofolate--homocysteine methyltransferase
MVDLQRLFQAIVDGDNKTARALAEEAIAAGADPQELLAKYMIPAMNEVGRLFEVNEYFVPELMISARAMKSAQEVLRPLLVKLNAKPAGKIVIGTVRGDLHDIGKSLVSTMLEGGGFEIVDLGVDVAPTRFVEAVNTHQPQIVALSALLTTTMSAMKVTIDQMRTAGVRDRVKVIVGGAPITQKFAADIGADGFSDNASGAVTLARSLVTSG